MFDNQGDSGVSTLRFESQRRRSRASSFTLVRLRLAVFFILMAIYLALLVIGIDFILPSQANDAKTVASLAFVSDGVESFDGYATMAFIYRFTTIGIRYTLLILVAGLYFYLLARNVTGIASSTVVVFLSFSATLLFLQFFVKDTFYALTVCLLCLSASLIKGRSAKISFFIFAMVVYAFFFRQYVLLIVAVFVFLVIFRISALYVRVSLILLAATVLLLLPNELYYELQSSRDLVNQGRIGFSGEGFRTAFVNLVPPVDLVSFLQNYGYAFVKLNLPIFGGIGLKEFVMTLQLAIIFFLLGSALMSPNFDVALPSLFFAAHLAVLLIFEPDLGSYLRHVLTSLPFLALALPQLDRLLGLRVQ